MSKAGDTNHQRSEARKAEFSASLHDREVAVTICREIRDSKNAGAMARLEAIRLLLEIQSR